MTRKSWFCNVPSKLMQARRCQKEIWDPDSVTVHFVCKLEHALCCFEKRREGVSLERIGLTYSDLIYRDRFYWIICQNFLKTQDWVISMKLVFFDKHHADSKMFNETDPQFFSISNTYTLTISWFGYSL